MLLCLMGFATACENKIIDASNKKDDDTLKSNSLVGEWYEVGSTENKGVKVIFTENTVTAFHYAYNYEFGGTVYNYNEKWYDGTKYSLDNTTLKVLEPPINSMPTDLLKTNVTFYYKDTLFIEHFVPNDATAPFPFNFNSIKLYKEI